MRMIRPLAAVAAGALLLAGCGGPTAADPTQPTATTAAPAAPSESAPPTTGPDAPADESVDAFIDLVSTAKMTTYTMDMAMTTEVQGTPMELSSAGTFDTTDPAKPRSHLTMNVSGLEMEMITVDGDYFMKMGMTGDQWMKMDAESAQDMAGSAAPDFSTWAESARDTIEAVELVGDDTVGGVAVKHYRLTMTPDAMADFGVEDSDLADATLGYDVWVDAEGFTRQFDVALAGGEMPMDMMATLDNFNEPVDIQAPKDWVEAPS